MGMKTLIFILILSLSPFCFAKKTVGLGVIVGAPTGLSGNFRLSGNHSLDAALAFDLTEEDSIHIHSTYLWRYPNAFAIESAQFGWYWGIGGRYKSREDRNPYDDDDEYRFGARGSAGIYHIFKKVSIEVFGEAALVMNILPKTDADLDIGVGGRYYF